MAPGNGKLLEQCEDGLRYTYIQLYIIIYTLTYIPRYTCTRYNVGLLIPGFGPAVVGEHDAPKLSTHPD